MAMDLGNEYGESEVVDINVPASGNADAGADPVLVQPEHGPNDPWPYPAAWPVTTD